MTKTWTDAAMTPAEHVSQPYFDRIAEVEFSLLRPLGGPAIAMADGAADMLDAWAAFAAARVRHGARACHAMLHCRSPAELQAVQAEFVQKAIEDYQVGAVRMAAVIEAAADRLGWPRQPD